MVKRKVFVKGKSIRIPESQYKQIERLLRKKGDFSSVAEYVRHCIREQLKRDEGSTK